MKIFTGTLLLLFFITLVDAAEGDSIRIRLTLDSTSGITTVKVLISHPMESGTRINNKTGELIPAHYINKVNANLKGVSVFKAIPSAAISKNPYFSFKFLGGSVGDSVVLSWEDNLGGADTITELII